MKMMEPRTHRRITRSRKKTVPLSKLRTSEVVKTVVDHPRRIEELVDMLEDKDRVIRSRAAATLARLSESHPGRLLRILERIKETLSDDSAYVRWHLSYTLGRVGLKFPARSQPYLNELSARLEDDNKVVRVIAARALGMVASRRPHLIQSLFQSNKREIPTHVARILRSKSRKPEKPDSR
jgi:HEAT repeat protein